MNTEEEKMMKELMTDVERHERIKSKRLGVLAGALEVIFWDGRNTTDPYMKRVLETVKKTLIEQGIDPEHPLEDYKEGTQ